MASEAQLLAQKKYDQTHTKSIIMKLNRTTDADVLKRLEEVENKQGYLKELVRSDIRTANDVLPLESIELLVLPAAKKYNFTRLYLFGSYARNEARQDSDIDLLVEGGDLSDFGSYQSAVDMISEATGKNTDLVTQKKLLEDQTRGGKRFREHVERDRILIYERNQ